ASPEYLSATLLIPASSLPVIVSEARMPRICPWSSTVSRAFSTSATAAASLRFAPLPSISVKCRTSSDRSSPFADGVAFSTVPRTAAPLRGPPTTTASTGSPAFELCVETLVLSRIGSGVPAGISAAQAAPQSSSARLLLADLRDRAIHIFNPQQQALALFELRLGGLEARRHHPVLRRVGGDHIAHHQRVVELLPQQRNRFEQSLGV